MHTPDEEMTRVLRDMCCGSVEAFDAFYSRFAPLVLQIAYRTLGDRMEAEDVCHDVFLEALRRGDSYEEGRGSVAAWLAVIARSRSLDRLRKRNKVIASDVIPAEQQLTADTAEERALERLRQEALKEALNQLPAEQRNAVIGRYYGAHTQREMSSAWNVPIGTVKSWLRYGLTNLRKQMDRRGWSQQQADNGSTEVQR
ncbi:RNA polymerase sigma factor [Paenibacillus xylaniclasticus]|uniref:RNA polymerase sigma factor n=1 Tax=Paenibacillus xylaniclasticus TaxID=588083 RepID=UPI000FDBBB7D|nr:MULTISPECIES: sigma-70 family RNA polymerase sigma factor [Paenibacillus]GFN33921.1 RNA polymerase sigma factor [Paenibacillus curdlanolyticus]